MSNRPAAKRRASAVEIHTAFAGKGSRDKNETSIRSHTANHEADRDDRRSAEDCGLEGGFSSRFHHAGVGE